MEDALAGDALSPRAQRVAVGATFLVCLAVRLATIGAPALDRTAWKEIDYIQISSNYWRHGYDFTCPEIAWPAEDPRCTAMELPLVPFIASFGYPVLGLTPLSVRWISLVSFVLLPLTLYGLVRRELGPLVACLAAFACAAMPLYHPFGRFQYSEPPMILCSALALHFFAKWLDSDSRVHWFGAMGAFSLAVALKLEPLYLLLPIGWLAFRRFRWNWRAYRGAGTLVAVSLLLPTIWYGWAFHLGRTSIDVFGVFGGHDKMQTLAMLTTLSWYRIMRWRVMSLILGGVAGTLLALAGLWAALLLRRASVFAAWLAAIAISFVIVAEGNIDAPYRQLPSVPPLAVFVAFGAIALGAAIRTATDLDRPRGAVRPRLTAVFAALVVATALPGARWKETWRTDPLQPWHPPQWDLAQAIRANSAPGDLLIALGEYTVHKGGNDLSPVLYHYSGLQGWTLQAGEWNEARVEQLRTRGATHLALSSMSHQPGAHEFVDTLRRHYPVLFEDSANGLVLLDLRTPADG